MSSRPPSARRPARPGDRVRVHYVGMLPDGTVFDTTEGRDPVEFTLGRGQLIVGFERAVMGKSPGSFVIENVPARHAFGDRLPQRVVRVPLERLRRRRPPTTGERVDVHSTNGTKVSGVVVDADEEMALVDANHPLAGQDLTFEIRVVDIVESRLISEPPATPRGARDSMIFG